MENQYLQKFGFLKPQIEIAPHPNVGIFVVIPCYDEPDLISSLESINNCTIPRTRVEIITVVNAGENSDVATKQKNSKTLNEAKNWALENSKEEYSFHFIENQNLPKKHAGVGLARKIGMDEAVSRLDQLEINDAPIICFDADSKCDSNYLIEIEKAFCDNPKVKGASVYFEHPLQGQEFDSFVYHSIANYELQLRYYKNAFEFTGHPQACFTIGSSMAVLASAYQSQGGMNKRKAGEDFYFMQKIIERFPIMEINSTRVIPSPRPSHRVPFGTGRAISEFQEGKNSNETYAFSAFMDLKILFNEIQHIYLQNELHALDSSTTIPESIKAFLHDQNFQERVNDLLEYGKTWETFHNRFYNWFNAFRSLKFVHFARDNFYPQIELPKAISILGEHLEINLKKENSNLELLTDLREYDRHR